MMVHVFKVFLQFWGKVLQKVHLAALMVIILEVELVFKSIHYALLMTV